jgi:hypothetical protein
MPGQVSSHSSIFTLAAQARLLDAAKGHFGGGDQAGVDAHHAVLQRLADAEDAADVAAVEVAGQAELGVVGQLDGLGLGLEAEHRRHRAEGFLGAQHVAVTSASTVGV